MTGLSRPDEDWDRSSLLNKYLYGSVNLLGRRSNLRSSVDSRVDSFPK